MPITINKIELQNWFNYKGDYAKNTFEFKEGLNILVGDNNAGKTKLHNAFRFILKGEVLLEREKVGGYVEQKIDENNISKVLNKSLVNRDLKLNDMTTLGVKLTFTEKIDDYDSSTFLVTKEIKCRKDAQNMVIKEYVNTIHRIDPRTKAPRKTDDEFEKITAKIIPNNFLSFFFVEGEQLGLMTPLEGDKLKDTINSIVNIGTIDDIENFSSDFLREANQRQYSIEMSEVSLSQKVKDDLKKKENLRALLDDNTGYIYDCDEKIQNNELIRDNFKTAFESSKQNKALKSQLDSILGKINTAEAVINTTVNKYIAAYMNQTTFSICKLINEDGVRKNIDEYIENVKSFIFERRTELDSKKLNKHETEMIHLLEKSQPKPEILDKMISQDWCFVCDNKLSAHSRDFIGNKLLPFFRGTLEDDIELTKLDNIGQMFNSLNLSSQMYYGIDIEYFDDEEAGVIEKINHKLELESEKNEFINKHGTVQRDDEEDVSLVTYERALRELDKAAREKERFIGEEKRLNSEIAEIEKNEKRDTKNVSPKLTQINSVVSFAKLLNETIVNAKDNEYSEFADRLGEKATRRYQEFMVNNTVAKKNHIRVQIKKDKKNKYDFKIDVLNKFNEIQEQPGGADQSLRRVAVVFGLLDMAENKRGYPFIADAPISKLSPDTKTAFFKSLLNYQGLSQCMILNMDLWSAEKQGLNDIGDEVFKLIGTDIKSRFITIQHNVQNNCVDINYLK